MATETQMLSLWTSETNRKMPELPCLPHRLAQGTYFFSSPGLAWPGLSAEPFSHLCSRGGPPSHEHVQAPGPLRASSHKGARLQSVSALPWALSSSRPHTGHRIHVRLHDSRQAPARTGRPTLQRALHPGSIGKHMR